MQLINIDVEIYMGLTTVISTHIHGQSKIEISARVHLLQHHYKDESPT